MRFLPRFAGTRIPLCWLFFASLITSAVPGARADGAAVPADGGRARSAEVTLEQAVEGAFRNSSRLRAEAARVDEARARIQSARTWPHNPELEVSGASRRSRGESVVDVEATLSQEVELAGQRGRRIDVAEAELKAAEAEALGSRRMLAAEVHLAFLDALEARELLAVAQAQAELARQLHDIARRRLEAGAGTQLELNVSAAELGRAEHVLSSAEGQYAVTRAILAGAMGEVTDHPAAPAGELAPTAGDVPPLEELLAAAQQNRTDVQALLQLEEAARARVDLARAEAWPNLRLSVFAGREEGTDTIIGGGIAIPLPLFQRNQGARAEAQAAAVRAGAERDAARLSMSAEIAAAYEQHRSGLRALAVLQERVVGTTAESLELLRKAYESGKATSTDVLVLRRTLFEAQQAITEASVQVRRARLRIDVAAGRLPLPSIPRAE